MTANRIGNVVTAGKPGQRTGRWMLIAKALPSGWWACPVGGGSPARLTVKAGTWTVADTARSAR